MRKSTSLLLAMLLIVFGGFTQLHAVTCAQAQAMPALPGFSWDSGLVCDAADDIAHYNSTPANPAESGISAPVYVPVAGGLSGNYTINKNAKSSKSNFASFNAFAAAINTGGLAGPVTVDVVAGTGPYVEQVMFTELPNSSDLNTLTINGNGETLQFLSTNTNARHTLAFNGTDYVTVNNLIIKTLGSVTGEFGWAVWLTNGADYHSFYNCQFIASKTATLNRFAGFVASNSPSNPIEFALAASHLTIENCSAIGGYYGIVISGPNHPPFPQNITIVNNQIKDFHQHGLYLRGLNNSMIADNVITRPTRTTTTILHMIWLTQDMSGTKIINNQMHDFSPSVVSTLGAYGIYAITLRATPGEEVLIANNVIYGFQNVNGAQYGMAMFTTRNTKLYHNSISLDHAAHTGSGEIIGFRHSALQGQPSDIDFRNNIISITSNSSGVKYCLYFPQTSANLPALTSDNNVLYLGATAGTNHIAYWSETNYTTLADWQGVASGSFDQNSVDASPIFVSPLITPSNPSVNNIGLKLWDVYPVLASDIFGIARGENPDPGAIEFNPLDCVQPSGFSASLSSSSALLTWDPSGDSEEWEVAVLPTGSPVPSEGIGVNTNSYLATDLIFGQTYDAYVRSVCDEMEVSEWTSITFSLNYCFPSSTVPQYYISAFSTTDALQNVSITKTAIAGNGYADYSDTEFIQHYPGATFNFSNTFSATSQNGLNIWIDWNDNLLFEAEELVYSFTSPDTTKTGTIAIPSGIPPGAYRMRIRAEYGSNANPPPCGNIWGGEAIDLTLLVGAASIAADPESIEQTLMPGQTAQQTLTIENTGSSELYYTTILVNTSSPENKTINQAPDGITQPASGIDLAIAKTSGGAPNENRNPYNYILNYDGDNVNAIGLLNGGEFYTAARYPAEMVYLFEGSTIQSVDVFINMTPTRATLHIWAPGTTTSPGALLYQQTFTPIANSWNTILLSTPFTLTGEDLWVGFKYEHGPGVVVAGIDGGPVNPKGDFLSGDGISWDRLSNYGFYGNWNIRSYLRLPDLGWLSINPASGSIEPGQSDEIQVSFDTDGMDEGVYNANIVIFSNDPLNEISFVPVELTVAYPEANILSYAFNTAENPSLSADAIGQVNLPDYTVTLELLENIDVSSLIATFTLSNLASASIGGVIQESGVTANNFTNPVVYTVTAEAGNTQDWTVTVNTLPCLSPWNFLVTGSIHTINIPLSAAPEIFGVPLAPLDWIGVFYLNDQGEETCGGAVQWTGTGNVTIIAYGDDPTTQEKDGFDPGEIFRWRLSQCGNPDDFTAVAAYNPNQPNQGSFASFGLSALTSLKAATIQYYAFNQGWNSISSYLNPIDPAVANMFSPIENNLTILSNLISVYWPAQGVNTIGNWNSNSGYVTKVTEDVELMIGGADYVSGTLTIPAGWSYLPVLSECPADVMEMFGGNLADVVIINELIGTGIFWPAYGINTIGNFQPGKAYAIKLVNPVTVTFPACDQKASTQLSPGINKISTIWGELDYSPEKQVTAIVKSALANLQTGDLLGAFNTEGLLCGYMEIETVDRNLAITLFGNDQFSSKANGLINGEPIFFKLYRSHSGEWFDLEVEYDVSLENSTGNYHTGSFAAITNIILKSTRIDEMNTTYFSLVPNPATDVVTITTANGISQNVEILIYDMHGKMLIEESFQQQTSLKIGHLKPGVYMVVLRTAYNYEVQKLLVK